MGSTAWLEFCALVVFSGLDLERPKKRFRDLKMQASVLGKKVSFGGVKTQLDGSPFEKGLKGS